MVVVGIVETPMSCLLGEGRLILPSLSEVVWNSSVGFPGMARSGDSGQLWVEPMTTASEPSPKGEGLRAPK
jgi:hypothetical protein